MYMTGHLGEIHKRYANCAETNVAGQGDTVDGWMENKT